MTALSASAEAPVLAGVMPSVAVHTTSCVPSAESEKEPVRGFVPAWLPTVTELPLDVQARAARDGGHTPRRRCRGTIGVCAASRSSWPPSRSP